MIKKSIYHDDDLYELYLHYVMEHHIVNGKPTPCFLYGSGSKINTCIAVDK